MESLVLKVDRIKLWNQFGKTEQNVAEDVEVVQKWLKMQNHLPEVPTDIMVQYFLTNCKFSIERTKQSLDMYYTTRTLMPEIYGNYNSDAPQVNDMTFVPLPNQTQKLQRIIFYRFNNMNIEKCNISTLIGHIFNTLYEVRIWEDLAMEDISIKDCKLLKLGFVTKVKPSDIKKIAFILEEVWNKNLKEIHYINLPSFAESFIKLLRTFFNKELREKIFVHATLEDLHKVLPKDILPQEYGGKEKSLDELEILWKNKVNQYKGRLEKLENLTVQEDLRPQYKNCDVLGYYGNYMQIDVK